MVRTVAIVVVAVSTKTVAVAVTVVVAVTEAVKAEENTTIPQTERQTHIDKEFSIYLNSLFTKFPIHHHTHNMVIPRSRG